MKKTPHKKIEELKKTDPVLIQIRKDTKILNLEEQKLFTMYRNFDKNRMKISAKYERLDKKWYKRMKELGVKW